MLDDLPEKPGGIIPGGPPGGKGGGGPIPGGIPGKGIPGGGIPGIPGIPGGGIPGGNPGPGGNGGRARKCSEKPLNFSFSTPIHTEREVVDSSKRRPRKVSSFKDCYLRGKPAGKPAPMGACGKPPGGPPIPKLPGGGGFPDSYAEVI